MTARIRSRRGVSDTSRRLDAWLRLESLEERETPAIVGGLDPSFGSGGKVLTNLGGTNQITAEAIQTDGKIVVVGVTNSGGTNDFLVARFNPDGSLDQSFNGNTGKQVINFGGADTAHGVAIQADGRIVVVGEGNTAPVDFCIARLNTDGTMDTTFNGTGQKVFALGNNDIATSVGIQSDGTIVVGGFSDQGGTNDFAVIRVNPTTAAQIGATKFIDFGGGNDQANALVVYPVGSARQDQIVMVGQGDAAIAFDFSVARLASDLSTVQQFSQTFGNVDIATGVTLGSNSTITVSGFTNIGGTNDFAALRLTDGLALDTTFNPTGAVTGTAGLARFDLGGDDRAFGQATQASGKVALAGVSSAPGSNQFAIIQVNADGSLDTSFAAPSNGKLFIPFAANDSANAVLVDPNGKIVAAGSSNLTNIALARVIGRVDATAPLAVGGSTNGTPTIYAPNTTGQYSLAPLPSGSANPFGGTGVDVRTAVADVNGDGTPDIILGTGPGVATQFAVVNGKDGTLLIPVTAAFAGSESFTGGVLVAAADFNNDGRAEVILAAGPGGGPRVTLFSLPTSGTAQVVANYFGIRDPNFRGGARAAAGDINGDGIPDLVVSAGPQGGPRIAVYNGTTVLTTTTNPTSLVPDFFAFPDVLRDGTNVAVGDVNGDGFDDLVFGPSDGGGPQVLIINGQVLLTSGALTALATPIASFFPTGFDPNARSGIRVAMKNADGDNRADLVVATGVSQSSRVLTYLGKNITAGVQPPVNQTLDPFGGAILADGVYVG